MIRYLLTLFLSNIYLKTLRRFAILKEIGIVQKGISQIHLNGIQSRHANADLKCMAETSKQTSWKQGSVVLRLISLRPYGTKIICQVDVD